MSYARLEDMPPAPPIRFRTAAELDALVPPHVAFVVQPGLAALGAITEIDGKIKAAGKTTLSLHITKAVVDGADFLGRPTHRSKVIYVTEQSGQTFVDALRRADLHRRGDELRIVLREDLGDTDWPDLVAQTQVEGYELCIFDTIGKLAGIVSENDAGEWAAAMRPLQDLAASGRAVLIDRHDRKGGGDAGDSGRGSSQASGDVDIILQLRRPDGNQPSTRRVIETLSRYGQTPEKMVVDLTADGYILLGDNEAVAYADAVRFIRSLLTYGLETNPFPLSSTDLIDRAREERGVGEKSIRRAASDLVFLGELVLSGRGVKGDPYLYDRPLADPRDSFVSDSDAKGRNESEPPSNGAHLDPATAFARYRDESSGGMWSKLDGRRPA